MIRSNHSKGHRLENYVSPKQVALALGVSEASVKRWCDKGLIRTSRTGGGHRRMHRQDVLDYLRRDQIAVLKPELLGLPPMAGSTERTEASVRSELQDALIQGNRERFRSIILRYYLSGRSVAETADHLVAPVFQTLGKRWECGELEIYEERRGCDIALDVVRELESMIPQSREPKIVSACATLSGDLYEVPLSLLSATLKEGGCLVEKLGGHVPAPSLIKALERIRPDFFCVSVSHVACVETFQESMSLLHNKTKELGATLIVGGHALCETLRRELKFDLYLENYCQLKSFVEVLLRKRVATQNQ